MGHTTESPLRGGSKLIKRRSLLKSIPIILGVTSGFSVVTLFKKPGDPWEEPYPVDATPPLVAGLSLSTPEEYAKTGKLVTVACFKAEMGQGTETIAVQLVAEELNTELTFFQSVLIKNPDELGDPATVASNSTHQLWVPMRQLGASLNALLRLAAADQWQISADECEISNGMVINRNNQSSLNWSQLYQRVKRFELPGSVKLKPINQFSILGKPQPQMALDAIVTGKPLFTLDQAVDKTTKSVMLQRAPSPWYQWVSDNRNELLYAVEHEGLIDIFTLEHPLLQHGGQAVVILAKSDWAAMKAKQALVVKWKLEEDYQGFKDSKAYTEYLYDQLVSNVLERDRVKVGTERVKNHIHATYALPFLAHQTIEPPCGIIDLDPKNKQCRIWLPTQREKKCRQKAAGILGWAIEQVEIYPQRLGGAFGRKAQTDYLQELLVVARRASQLEKHQGPLRLLWNRKDDLRHDFYRPAAIQYLSAYLGETGEIQRWAHYAVTPDGRQLTDSTLKSNPRMMKMGADPILYSVDEHQVAHIAVKSELPTGIWRSVHFSQHTYAVESFIEKIAHSLRQDPLKYRQAHLRSGKRYSEDWIKSRGFQPKRMVRLIERMIEKVPYQTSISLAGKEIPVGIGYAVVYAFDTYVVAAVEVFPHEPKHRSDRVWQIHRISLCIDAGFIVNPDGANAQVEGATIFGLSSALYGGIKTQKGVVKASNFNDEPLATLRDVPDITVEFLGQDRAPAGLGEPVVPVISPALCNAIKVYTGDEVTQLPLMA